MSKKEIQKLKTQYKNLHKEDNWQEAFGIAEQIIDKLFTNKDYAELI